VHQDSGIARSLDFDVRLHDLNPSLFVGDELMFGSRVILGNARVWLISKSDNCDKARNYANVVWGAQLVSDLVSSSRCNVALWPDSIVIASFGLSVVSRDCRRQLLT
jgi:hypothetical protein